MSLVDKFKNLFTEEVEEEVKPIKKEVRHVEIPSPKRETRIEEPIEKPSNNVSINKEEKFVFPVYFDDKDFDDLEKPTKVQPPVKKEPPKKEIYQGPKVQPMEKKFQSSPIISPVYGILDKNYKKEDISTRTELPSDYARKPKKMTVDDIRNKAFGTLEDDLEDTLFGEESLLFQDPVDQDTSLDPMEDTAIDIFGELHFDEDIKDPIESMNTESKIEDVVINTVDDMDEDTKLLAKQLEEQKRKLEQINDYINENAMDEIPEEEIEQVKPIEDSNRKNPEDLTESELLSLVDAMYEKRDDE